MYEKYEKFYETMLLLRDGEIIGVVGQCEKYEKFYETMLRIGIYILSLGLAVSFFMIGLLFSAPSIPTKEILSIPSISIPIIITFIGSVISILCYNKTLKNI